MSAPDKLNDPYEGEFRIHNLKSFHNEVFIRKLMTFNWKNELDDFLVEERIQQAVCDEAYFTRIFYEYVNDLIRSRYGISSFSRRATSLKMWSHYADSHSGVCLVFDEKILVDSFSKVVGVIIRDVEYVEDIPYVKIENHEADEFADDFIGIEGNSNSFLFTKVKEWKEEEEVRILFDQDFNLFPSRLVKFDIRSLKGIVLGARMNKSNVSAIESLIRSSSKLNEINILTATKNINSSNIEIRGLNA